MMYEESVLREQFQALLSQERQVAAGYADLAASTSDPKLREEIERLYRQKQRHVKLAERLLEIVEE